MKEIKKRLLGLLGLGLSIFGILFAIAAGVGENYVLLTIASVAAAVGVVLVTIAFD